MPTLATQSGVWPDELGVELDSTPRIVERDGRRRWADGFLKRGATFFVWLPPIAIP